MHFTEIKHNILQDTENANESNKTDCVYFETRYSVEGNAMIFKGNRSTRNAITKRPKFSKSIRNFV